MLEANPFMRGVDRRRYVDKYVNGYDFDDRF